MSSSSSPQSATTSSTCTSSVTSFCNFGIGSFAGLGGSGGGGGGVSKTTAATAAATTTPRLNHSRGNNNRSHSTVSPSSSSHESVGSTSDEADQVGARELGMLTPSQRERLFEEIHGIIDVHEEDPTFISKCLLDVDEELSKIRDKSAYSRALFLAPRYVKDDNFRLMFLRATNFHPKHAAKKIVSHFKFKAELFGLTKVAKTITLDDLDEADDMIALRSGGTIFLSETDSAGRPITLAYRTKNNLKSYKSEFRAQWYSAMVALENQELQKRGAVIVCFTLDLDGPLGSGYETMSKYHMLRDGLPLRRASFHFCYNNSAMRTAVSIFRTVAGPDFRLRFRDHFGSYQECAYALLQYGINNNKFPFDENGKINHDVIDQWITRRKQKEQCIKEKEESTKEIYTPTINDVLLGRGKPFQNHWGNLQMVKLLEEREEEYKQADRFQKTCLSWEMVKKIQREYDGRFLEKDDALDQWRVVSDEVAREKVASGFRSIKKLIRSTTSGISCIVLEDNSESTARTEKRAKFV